MNISFAEKQQQYISEQVLSGDFLNASEVVRDALRLNEIYRNRLLEDLRLEIMKGWDGPASKLKVSDIIEAKTRSEE